MCLSRTYFVVIIKLEILYKFRFWYIFIWTLESGRNSKRFVLVVWRLYTL